MNIRNLHIKTALSPAIPVFVSSGECPLPQTSSSKMQYILDKYTGGYRKNGRNVGDPNCSMIQAAPNFPFYQCRKSSLDLSKGFLLSKVKWHQNFCYHAGRFSLVVAAGDATTSPAHVGLMFFAMSSHQNIATVYFCFCLLLHLSTQLQISRKPARMFSLWTYFIYYL